MEKYPILNSKGEFIPLELMKEHENQCLVNHKQSVQRLSERGGTTYLETYYILLDCPYKDVSENDFERVNVKARMIVQALAYEWLMKNKKL